jgi:hypothetical protein
MKGKTARGRSKRAARRPVRRKPANLVAEIVDQITEKQDRATRGPGSPAPSDRTDPAPGEAASPYRFVVKCGG